MATVGEAERDFRRLKDYRDMSIRVAAPNKHHRKSRRARKAVGTQKKTAR